MFKVKKENTGMTSIDFFLVSLYSNFEQIQDINLAFLLLKK